MEPYTLNDVVVQQLVFKSILEFYVRTRVYVKCILNFFLLIRFTRAGNFTW